MIFGRLSNYIAKAGSSDFTDTLTDLFQHMLHSIAAQNVRH